MEEEGEGWRNGGERRRISGKKGEVWMKKRKEKDGVGRKEKNEWGGGRRMDGGGRIGLDGGESRRKEG